MHGRGAQVVLREVSWCQRPPGPLLILSSAGPEDCGGRGEGRRGVGSCGLEQGLAGFSVKGQSVIILLVSLWVP